MTEPRPLHRIVVEVIPDAGYEMDEFEVVRKLIEEAIWDSGMTNGATVRVYGENQNERS